MNQSTKDEIKLHLRFLLSMLKSSHIARALRLRQPAG
jgi:hypothetical protein